MNFFPSKYLIFALAFFCCSQTSILSEVFVLPESIKEASALETAEKSKFLWTLEDSGNAPKLFALDSKGKLAHSVMISNAQNVDWEALASDKDGNLYIGDFGNNDNERRDLCIYKIDRKDLKKSSAEYAMKTSFHYPEQTEFPPKKPGRIYDAEAFIHHQNRFYIFTKNRNGKSGTSVYSIPATEGNHAAKLLGTIETCDDKKCAITDADISDDGKKIILLSNRKIWIVENFQNDDFANASITQTDLHQNTQLEGVCFKTDSKVWIVDERDKGTGGKVYEMKL